ncbi:hypothetical protein RRG08_037811 [Elysia crispata]|uniref:Uncharacterized protein n=1 Tax=Elysia crispata TaxID=231223 RepID=A0AAE1BBY2_9GAST|nr:hypothetical protein RRG08_037811 [Elysia crispata]
MKYTSADKSVKPSQRVDLCESVRKAHGAAHPVVWLPQTSTSQSGRVLHGPHSKVGLTCHIMVARGTLAGPALGRQALSTTQLEVRETTFIVDRRRVIMNRTISVQERDPHPRGDRCGLQGHLSLDNLTSKRREDLDVVHDIKDRSSSSSGSNETKLTGLFRVPGKILPIHPITTPEYKDKRLELTRKEAIETFVSILLASVQVSNIERRLNRARSSGLSGHRADHSGWEEQQNTQTLGLRWTLGVRRSARTDHLIPWRAHNTNNTWSSHGIQYLLTTSGIQATIQNGARVGQISAWPNL